MKKLLMLPLLAATLGASAQNTGQAQPAAQTRLLVRLQDNLRNELLTENKSGPPSPQLAYFVGGSLSLQVFLI